MPIKSRVIILLGALVLIAVPASAQKMASDVIRAEVEQIRYAKEYGVGPVQITGRELIADFYVQRQFAPAWERPAQIDALIETIRGIEADGLSPEDYHLAALEAYRDEVGMAGVDPERRRAEFDLILTDSLIRLCYNLIFGKVDPATQHASWNYNRDVDDLDPVSFLRQALDAEDIARFIQALIPEYAVYTDLKAALADYRRLAATGGWARVPEGETLEKGMQGERVAALCRRLAASGDLEKSRAATDRFDDAVEAAVKRFQKRHYIAVDGAVGPGTLAELNVGVEARIDQVRVNLERLRWVLHDIPPRFIFVDIAGYRVYAIKAMEEVWEAKVQIGRPYRQTPSFRADMKYIVFNPTWTIPPGILAKDVLPAVKKDPGYLQSRNISVIDRNGRPVDTRKIDWATITPRRFPYMLRQEPGPSNALGQVKFIFPNSHFVFLHDTPSKNLFRRTDRAFSSGCIRVERPFELAALLLQDVPGWDRSKIEAVVAAGRSETVFLPGPLPVLMVYLTAERIDGQMLFKNDIYNRDPPLLEALDSPFRYHDES